MKALLVTYCILVVSAFVVPYTVLKDVHTLSGAFLFWTIFAVACIALLCAMMNRWNDEQ